jgi:hypothetical protein
MIHTRKLSLFWLAALFLLASAAADETATVETESCGSICRDVDGLKKPDLVIEYNWNHRVPVCAGLSCDSGTCAELQRKLPSFEGDETDCQRHKTGLQEAGCECSGGASHSRGSIGIVAIAAAAAVSSLLF